MAKWQKMDTAPKTGEHILILTGDFGIVEGWWDETVTNYYASQEGWACYDPENMQGDWVTEWHLGQNDPDRRLYCGATPNYWASIGVLPTERRTRRTDPAAAREKKRNMDRERQMAKRREAGARPRAEYLESSLSQTRPWDKHGISRATWHRRQKAMKA